VSDAFSITLTPAVPSVPCARRSDDTEAAGSGNRSPVDGDKHTESRGAARLIPRCFGRSHRRAQRHPWLLRSIRPKRATLRSLSQPDGVDGGTAQAAPELPPPPCDRGTGRRHSCPTARGPPKRLTQPEETVGLRAEAGPAVLHPLGPPRGNPAGECGVDVSRRSGRYPFPGEPVKLEPGPPSMHAGRDGTSPSDGARVPVGDAAGAAVGSRVDERRDPYPFRRRARRPPGGR
jgi:hypothetical protein